MHGPASASRWRSAWQERPTRVAAFLAYLLACLLVLEGALRLFPIGKRPRTYTEAFTGLPVAAPLKRSDYLPFTLATEADLAASGSTSLYRTNALGYRGVTPKQLAKAENQRRILLLGDSFTYGWSQPDEKLTFPAFLSGMVARAAPDWEVINGGYRAGYSPDGYYAFLAGREAVELAPDIVVVNLFTNNDVSDLADSVWARTDAHGTPTHVFTRSRTADYLGNLISEYSIPWYYRAPLLRDSVLAIWIGQSLPEPAPETIDSAARFVAVVDGFVRLARERPFDLYIVAFDVPNVRMPKGPIKKLVETTLRERLDERHVRILHGFYAMKHEIPGDGHWNEEGARVHARQVFSLIAPALGAKGED